MLKNLVEGFKILFIQGYLQKKVRDGHERMDKASLRFYQGLWVEWKKECSNMKPTSVEEEQLIQRFLELPCEDEDDFQELLALRRRIHSLKEGDMK